MATPSPWSTPSPSYFSAEEELEGFSKAFSKLTVSDTPIKPEPLPPVAPTTLSIVEFAELLAHTILHNPHHFWLAIGPIPETDTPDIEEVTYFNLCHHQGTINRSLLILAIPLLLDQFTPIHHIHLRSKWTHQQIFLRTINPREWLHQTTDLIATWNLELGILSPSNFVGGTAVPTKHTHIPWQIRRVSQNMIIDNIF